MVHSTDTELEFKMNKLTATLLAFAALTWSGAAVAAEGYGAAGCGLGSMVFGAKPGMTQLLAATTNGTFGSQTFGITSGTSNCTSGGIIKEISAKSAFVETNFESLASEMSAGEGEHLAALATLMGWDEGSQAAFFAYSQANAEQLISTPAGMLSSLRAGVASDAVLGQSCVNI